MWGRISALVCTFGDALIGPQAEAFAIATIGRRKGAVMRGGFGGIDELFVSRRIAPLQLVLAVTRCKAGADRIPW